MLQNIRDKTQGWITRVVVGLVCASFILWGVHSFSEWSGGGNGVIASVNGQNIRPPELRAAFQRLLEQQQAQLGANFKMTDKMQSALQQMALQQLIASDALVQAAKKEGFRFTGPQVGGVIAGISAFQENGHFSSQKFEQALSNLGYSESDFFDNIRNAMLINQVRVGVVGSSFALPWESAEALQLVNQKRDIHYLQLSLSHYPVSVSDQDIQAYYQAHQADFTTPQTMVLQYLELGMPELMKQKHLKDAQAASQAFADAIDKLNNLTYTNPKTLEPAAKALGLSIQTSPELTLANPGKGIFASDAVKKAMSSKDVLAGNNSAAINLDDQHVLVIRALSLHPSQVKPLAEVKGKIESILKAQKQDAAAATDAQNIVGEVMQGKDLSAVAAEKHQAIMSLSNLTHYAKGVNAAIANDAFQLPRPGNHPSVGLFRLPSKDYVVMQVTKVSEPSAPQANQAVQARVMNDQIANAYAQLEYQLYVSAALNDAKIHVYGEPSA